MRYELFLALRYLGGLKSSQPFVSVIAVISVLGVALGVAALLVVLGVMSGFDSDLESKILGIHPHLIVEAEGGIEGWEPLVERILQFPGVKGAAPFIQTQALLRSRDEAMGVILKCVDPLREPKVTGLAQSIREGTWPPRQGELILGSELAHRLGIAPGDEVGILLGERSPLSQMKVGALFTTGMYDYDLHLVVTSLQTAQELLGGKVKVSGIGVRVEKAIQAPNLKRSFQQQLGFPYWVMSWMDLNQNLFAALKLEKVTMFVILTLIVLVACFNIVATLLMVVVEKTKEIGILKAIGATNTSIRRIFTWAGLLIGLIGTAIGTLVGLGLCGALAKYQFIRLPPSIYYIDRLPVRLEWGDALAVILAALALSWVACLYPTLVATRLKAAEAIRYE